MSSLSRLQLMDRLIWHSGVTVILYAVAKHLALAALVFFEAGAAHVTPTHTLWILTGGHRALAATFALCALTALVGCLAPKRPWGLALMLPQQMMLVVIAFGTIVAVWYNVYPDGELRPWYFILADHVDKILLAPAYTLGILTFHNVFRRGY